MFTCVFFVSAPRFLIKKINRFVAQTAFKKTCSGPKEHPATFKRHFAELDKLIAAGKRDLADFQERKRVKRECDLKGLPFSSMKMLLEQELQRWYENND